MFCWPRISTHSRQGLLQLVESPIYKDPRCEVLVFVVGGTREIQRQREKSCHRCAFLVLFLSPSRAHTSRRKIVSLLLLRTMSSSFWPFFWRFQSQVWPKSRHVSGCAVFAPFLLEESSSSGFWELSELQEIVLYACVGCFCSVSVGFFNCDLWRLFGFWGRLTVRKRFAVALKVTVESSRDALYAAKCLWISQSVIWSSVDLMASFVSRHKYTPVNYDAYALVFYSGDCLVCKNLI